MNRWTVLRAVSITGCALSIGAAVWISINCFAALRGYGTFWVGVAAAGAMYFAIGYAVFSTGWKQSEEGSLILALVALLGSLASVGFVVRVYIEPPLHPTLANSVVTIIFAWMMIWLSAVFTRRQVEARRVSRSVRR